jgi:ATP/maltotriose-dependent transcriptional regulator MalT/DNA-binding SARP family transcriptional activator
MKERSRPIAKLVRPSAGELLRRERLFAVLDAARRGKAVWISAPGGAGKTSLAASWIEARRLPCLWLALDAGDADPASFFFHLTMAARAAFGAAALPPFGEGQRADLGLFARRFFEQLFAAVEPPLVVVLDNYQALAADAPVHAATDALFASVPPGVLAVIASREAPPPRLARWLAAADLTAIEYPLLRLTRAETGALATARGMDPNGRLDRLHELARGWAAGVVLLARGLAQGLPLPRPGDAPPTAVFDYFAVEVFDQAPPAMHAFLHRTAFLTGMTAAMAEAASGEPRAAGLLEALHRGHLFVERRDEAEAFYEYHPLFREFLQVRAAAALEPAALREIRDVSARLLAARGEVDAAGRLFAANEDWPGLAGVVRAHAAGFAVHGRHAALRGLIDLAPAAVRDRDPWLVFWRAWCRMAAQEGGWRTPLEQAFERFEAERDLEGAFTAGAWLLRTSLAPGDAARWIAVAERLAAAHPGFADPYVEARVVWQFHQVRQFPPHHPLVARWADRAEALVRTLDQPALRLRMAAFALGVHFAHGDVRRMGALVAATRTLPGCEQVPPGDELAFLIFRGYYQLHMSELEAAATTLTRVEVLASETGAARDLAAAWHLGARVALCVGDAARARVYQDRLAALGDSLPPYPCHVHTTAAYVALHAGDLDAAAAAARAAMAYADVFPMFRPIWRANLAQVLLESGDAARARAELEAVIAEARASRLPSTGCAALLLHAAALLRLGEGEPAGESLREGLAAARSLGCVPQLPFILRPTLARLAARALESGIEREAATDLVARWRLAPPSAEEERWPWGIRVRALGAFELAIAGDLLNGAARTQRKPVDLLKCLVAFGGRDVAAAAVMQALWPDAEGDAAKRSFDVTLHRLRRLLGRDDAIALEAGKLALNPEVMWVDALAFERLAARTEEALRGTARAPGMPVAELLDRTLRLYRGPLLASDDEAWLQPVRERLRHRYLALVERAGEFLERSERADAALACYQRALDLDPPAERIYQRIMRFLHARGRRAEALEVYRSCREMLAATLGAQPSSETEALHRLLRGG